MYSIHWDSAKRDAVWILKRQKEHPLLHSLQCWKWSKSNSSAQALFSSLHLPDLCTVNFACPCAILGNESHNPQIWRTGSSFGRVCAQPWCNFPPSNQKQQGTRSNFLLSIDNLEFCWSFSFFFFVFVFVFPQGISTLNFIRLLLPLHPEYKPGLSTYSAWWRQCHTLCYSLSGSVMTLAAAVSQYMDVNYVV